MINFNNNINTSNRNNLNFRGYKKIIVEKAELSPLMEKACQFAEKHHEGQYRKHPLKKVPYFNHVFNVGINLKRAGFSDEVSAAGILHDTIEDTDVTYKILKKTFGKKIADLVNHVTEQDKSLSWTERKNTYYNHMAVAPEEAKAISAFDKLDSLECDLELYEETGKIPFEISKGSAHENIRNRDFLLQKLKEANISKKVIDPFEQAFNKVKKICNKDK